MMRWFAPILAVAFGTTGCSHSAYHKLAAEPIQDILPYPSYLLAIEKVNAKKYGAVPYGTCPAESRICINLNSPYLTDKAEWKATIERRLDDSRRLLLTHIVRYDSPPNNGQWTGRLISSLYRDGKLSCRREACVNEGLDALKTFEEDLRQRIRTERASHVLLYATGWNSDQVDSIQRYRQFFGQLMDAAAGSNSFRPIFVGITWPADWIRWLERIDVINKKNDADEVGLTWANYVLNQILVPLKPESGVKIVAIGHSYGGRIVATAANSRDLLPRPVEGGPDLVIGLQAAFGIHRFGDGTEGHPFSEFQKYAGRFAFTASEKDEAGEVALASVFNSILGEEGLREAQSDRLRDTFQVIRVDEDGNWRDEPRTGVVTLFDATAIVANHNDVKNAAMGRLIWRTIEHFAPPRRPACSDSRC